VRPWFGAGDCVVELLASTVLKASSQQMSAKIFVLLCFMAARFRSQTNLTQLV